STCISAVYAQRSTRALSARCCILSGAPGTCCVKIPSLLRTSTFQLALLYMVLFAASVFILLAFIYWRTAGYMAEQTDETIEAEIVGLAEQYRGRGINGLINIIRERVARD